MKEQLTSFETAKLAKEKGFSEIILEGDGTGNITGVYKAPTQSLLQKWLREKHKIHIEILLEDNNPYTKFYTRLMNVGKYFTLSHDGIYSESYEEALEKALQEALKLIK